NGQRARSSSSTPAVRTGCWAVTGPGWSRLTGSRRGGALGGRTLTRLTDCRLRSGVHAGLLALLRGDRGRRLGQRVVAAAGLGERDDVADGLRTGQQRDDAVP